MELICILVIGFLVYLGYRVYENRNKSWQDLADQTGLTFERKGPSVAGKYRGRRIKLDTYNKTSGGYGGDDMYLRVILLVDNNEKRTLSNKELLNKTSPDFRHHLLKLRTIETKFNQKSIRFEVHGLRDVDIFWADSEMIRSLFDLLSNVADEIERDIESEI